MNPRVNLRVAFVVLCAIKLPRERINAIDETRDAYRIGFIETKLFKRIPIPELPRNVEHAAVYSIGLSCPLVVIFDLYYFCVAKV